MRYKLQNLTIYRADPDGTWYPVKMCQSKAEARGLMVALSFNPEAGADWPVMVGGVLVAKSGASEPPMLPPGLPEMYREKYERMYAEVLADTGSVYMAEQAANGVVRRLMMGMAVKSQRDFTGMGVQAHKDGDLTTVNGWGVMFSDPDILDTWDTYFAGDTDFLERYYPSAPLWYAHGEDPAYGHIPIGVRYRVARYKFGLHVVHALHKDHPLFERTHDELVNGLLAYSSDSIGHYVNNGFDGVKLGVWPLAGFSLVKRPAEPGLGLVTLGLGNSDAA